MRFLVEEAKYSYNELKDFFETGDNSDSRLLGVENLIIRNGSRSSEAKTSYTGYYYSEVHEDFVFILPKAFLSTDNKVLGRNLDDLMKGRVDLFNEKTKDPLLDASIFLYMAMEKYKLKQPNTGALDNIVSGSSQSGETDSLINIILNLRRFYMYNQDFFISTIRESKSGFNKINWRLTFTKTSPIIKKKNNHFEIIYPKPQNRKRQIDFEDPLMLIFFSIMHYIRRYGIRKHINLNYEIIPEGVFEGYLNGYGVTKMYEIRHKYFSDKAIELWQLCINFFRRQEKLKKGECKEFLITNDFNLVFESMVDDIIGDKEWKNRYNDMLNEGRRFDHIALSKDLLFEGKKIFYIGDSKYYSATDPIRKDSIGKQFAYARNLVQGLMALKNHGKDGLNHAHLLCDHDQTEGYFIIPNFFIRATVRTSGEGKEMVFSTDGHFTLIKSPKEKVVDLKGKNAEAI